MNLILVVIRTDASTSIGIGHITRCLTLADALAVKGAQVVFICREHKGHLCDLIEKRGYAVHRLPIQSDSQNIESTPIHATWLGAHWKQDADQTNVGIISLKIKPDWLVIDHYGIDYRWEARIRPFVNHILVIDDLADRTHDCNVLLDQNLVARMQTRYFHRVSKNCILLLGPDYALLQPIYAHLHNFVLPREGPIRRIFISFGGADNDNLTGLVLVAFIALNRTDIEVDVVISNNNPNIHLIRDQIKGHPNIHLYCNLPTLALLMAKADLSIGGAGTTSWERLCMGLPSIVIVMAENQGFIADFLEKERLIMLLGKKEQVTVQTLIHSIAKMIEEDEIFEWSLRCLASCDGRGVYRVVEFLVKRSE